VRILQNGTLLARLSAVKRQDDRFTALWHGPPPPFGPTEQVAPLVVESDDGLERRDCWLYSITAPTRGEGPLCVELGAERNAPPWRQKSSGSSRQSVCEGVDKDKPLDDILAVDDDPETLALVAEALEEQGFAVRRASSGREALATMAKHPPTVAIIDLIMPEVGGEEVCAELRRNPRFMGTRILVLSGAEDTRVVAASCDADGAVTKPFTTELLVHEVRRLIGQ
jgi:CheY-like chemotaxis protein